MQLNVHEAKTQLSRLLEMVEQGESIVIARNGKPVAELVPCRKRGIQFGSGREDPDVNQDAVAGDWWKAMSDEEVEDFFERR
ncbi:MAG: type II toxin-antitoxin system Phd/YefM family antitoxin [Bryobacteraceae bacterium]